MSIPIEILALIGVLLFVATGLLVVVWKHPPTTLP